MTAVISLLTDFGMDDPFVGVMKGIMLSRAPGARFVDLTHGVPPQQIVVGALMLESAWRFFPEGTVHLAVVDPGVGTARRRLAMRAGGHYFVGPDNGLLSAALPDETRGRRQDGRPYTATPVLLPTEIEVVAIENKAILLEPLSATFEGRDAFAPAAAHLAAGGRLSDLGPPVREVLALPAFRAPVVDNQVRGLVLHADRYGNLITDIRPEDLPDGARFEAGGRSFGLAASYAEIDGVAALAASHGFVEVAARNGSAAALLRLAASDAVIARP